MSKNEIYLSAGTDGLLHAEDGSGVAVDLFSLSGQVARVLVVSRDMVCLDVSGKTPSSPAVAGDGS